MAETGGRQLQGDFARADSASGFQPGNGGSHGLSHTVVHHKSAHEVADDKVNRLGYVETSNVGFVKLNDRSKAIAGSQAPSQAADGLRFDGVDPGARSSRQHG